jgi:hypothetical protein
MIGYVEAAEARAIGQRLDSAFTTAKFREASRSDNPTYLAQRARIHEGMRKARLPEGWPSTIIIGRKDGSAVRNPTQMTSHSREDSPWQDWAVRRRSVS